MKLSTKRIKLGLESERVHPFPFLQILFRRRRSEIRHETGVDLTKVYFFGNEEFFRFLLLSLAVVQYTHFLHMLQTL